MNLNYPLLFTNLPKMYTLYVYVLFIYYIYTLHVFQQQPSPIFKHMLQGSALILSIATLLVYLDFKLPAFQSFLKKYSPGASIYIFILLEILIHQLPLFVVGLPTNIYYLWLSYILLLIYYSIFRNHIQDIYINAVHIFKYDKLIIRDIPIILLLYTIIYTIYRVFI